MTHTYRDLAMRFCATLLPDTVCADSCASDPSYPYPRTGTNLFTVDEAEQVLRDVLTGYNPMQAVGGGKNPDYRGPRMDFGQAIDALKERAKVARAGWNGKGMFVYLVPAASYPAQTGAAKSYFGEGSMVPYNAYLALKGVDGAVSTWVPSITDVLANDWAIVLNELPAA